MKKRLMAMVGAVAICALAGFVSSVMAADANKPREAPLEKDTKLVIGIVTVEKDTDGNFTEIKVTAHRDLIYHVVLDEKGIELGKTLADKRARIEGLIEIKGKAQWLTIKTFSEAKAQTPAKPGQNPKARPTPPKPAPKPRY
jgi:hypothetical protein